MAPGWLNYLILPEALNKEWQGQGVISWAKTRVYEPLKRRCDGKRNTAIPIHIRRLQVRLVSDQRGAPLGSHLRQRESCSVIAWQCKVS